MSYIIMAIQEEGSETRISDYDTDGNGFASEERAYDALDKAKEHYPEYRQIWVEQLKDMDYWARQIMLGDEYGPGYMQDPYDDY